MMQDTLILDRIDHAEVLLKPRRIDILRLLAEPHSCPELAALLEETTQKIYYHVKRLKAAGLAERIAERRVKGIMEGVYQARARSYWLSPELVGRLGPKRAQSDLSLGFLLNLAEELQSDIARLMRRTDDIPTLGLTAEIRLRSGDRDAFLRDLQSSIQDLLARHGRADGEAFTFSLACYPREHAE